MHSLRQFKLYGSGVNNEDCANSAETHFPVASVQPRQLNGEEKMQIVIEITKRYTFKANVHTQEQGEVLQEQLLQAAKSGNEMNLPDNCTHRGTDVAGCITFCDLRW